MRPNEPKYPKNKVCIAVEAKNGIMEARICKEYKYLGTTLNRDDQISNRITKVRRILVRLNRILWNKNITKKRKFDTRQW